MEKAKRKEGSQRLGTAKDKRKSRGTERKSRIRSLRNLFSHLWPPLIFGRPLCCSSPVPNLWWKSDCVFCLLKSLAVPNLWVTLGAVLLVSCASKPPPEQGEFRKADLVELVR